MASTINSRVGRHKASHLRHSQLTSPDRMSYDKDVLSPLEASATNGMGRSVVDVFPHRRRAQYE